MAGKNTASSGTDLHAYLQKLFAEYNQGAEPQKRIEVTEGQLQSFVKLIELLAYWNKSLNLTAIRDEKEMALLHIMDSAVVSPLLGDARLIADVGTGAGFPGLVLALLNPDKEFTLVDSIAKKLAFVTTAATQLNLTNVKIVQARVEQLESDEGFEVIVSRAFAPLERMVNWCLPLLKPEGRFIAMKAHLTKEELSAVPSTVRTAKIESLQVPGLDALRQAVILTRTETE